MYSNYDESCVLKHPHHYNVGMKHPFYGKHHTEETKQKMRISKLGENNPNHGKHTWCKGLNKETDKRVGQRADALRGQKFPENEFPNRGMRGKHHKTITKEKIKKNWKNEEIREKQTKAIRKRCQTKEFKEKMSRIVFKLWKNKDFREKHSGKNHHLYGKFLPMETKIKISESEKGEKHWNWQGGKSFEPYNANFDYRLKEAIRNRDSRRCQECGKQEGIKKLAVHHIDYDKMNCNPENLIALCLECNVKVNTNRGYWTNHFRRLMK